jgi:hypothetical protein
MTPEQIQAVLDKIKQLAMMQGAQNDAYLTATIPYYFDLACDKCHQQFDPDDIPSGVMMFIAQACKFNIADVRLKGRTMGNVSYTFNTEIPDTVIGYLRPYRKLSWGT